MYLSYIFIALDYFRTLRWRVVLFEWGVPLLLVGYCYHTLYKHCTTFPFEDYANRMLGLEGVLVGFSITSITFLTAGSNKNIEELRAFITKYRIGQKQLSLHDTILINYSYSLLIEIITVIGCLCGPLFAARYEGATFTEKAIAFCICLFFVVHTLFVNIRNLADIHHVLLKTSK